ncbi:hypothetical protein [Rhodohalobacter sp. 8-1]|uniref:hypothetical protein n=1 Tax=Rhodohalobacter sp. 8-1 TaxID=3131972 RepID=UPI0030ED1EAE
MPALNTILIPVLGGFIFVKYSYLTRFRAVRDNGYVILFKSAVVGLSFYGFSFLLWRAAILDEYANPKIPEWIEFLHDFLAHPELLPALLSLVFIGTALTTFNYILDKDEMKKRIIRQDDDAFEMTLLKSFERNSEVLITLDSRKVYMGKVTDTYFCVNDEIQSIMLNPLSSGYRDSINFKIEFTTYYGEIYKQIIDKPEEFDVKVSDFSVAIRYDKIVSVSPFDPKTYTKFRELGTK